MKLIHDANASTRETYRNVRWVLDELVSSEAKRNAAIGLACLLVSITCLSAIPFTLKFVYDAYNIQDTVNALWGLGYTLCASIGVVVFGSLHDHFREKMWNRNYFTLRVGLIWKLFTRSREEVLGDKSDFGVEQVEKTKDNAQNILYLIFFESPVVVMVIFTSTLFLGWVDIPAAIVVTLLTLFNVLWFYLFNTKIDALMEPIDKKFRSESRRSHERVSMYPTVTAHGVEEKMVAEISQELTEPLAEDLEIWAYWFQLVDIWRRVINAIVPVAIVAYGIYQGTWSLGELTAVAAWVFAISREYGYIGHLMRHLTSQAVRVQAARITLSTPSVLDDDGDIILERRL